MRLFVGLPLPAVAIDELSSVAARLRSSSDALRWTAPDSWHITVQFLGNTEGKQYECTVQRLRQVRAPGVAIALNRGGKRNLYAERSTESSSPE